MAAARSLTTLRMKLLVDTRGQRVLFAEASKEVVDFLFSLLALPVGAVAMLLGQEDAAATGGSVGGLYRSVVNLERSFAQPGADMDALLLPAVPPPAAGCVGSLLRLPDASARPRCPSCGGRPPLAESGVQPSRSSVPNGSPADAGGFVRGNMTYMVRDDLAVAPMSTISSISVFNALAVRGLGAVHERTVQIGHTEALKILKASFESKTVLTDVFLRGRAPAPGTLAR
ncbi:uncharacterized protein [Setaria viridis]|uniref:DUF674 family protein n=1 Tax=Setaria viridis TaxID=4556 RepID=A0A4U6UI95_SETVI|nr:uncharacterized protein LOC117856194 [Setaria viridis]TKW13499.1 hypothetical protein SEVIR_5G104900v2 [Setaria viridis]